MRKFLIVSAALLASTAFAAAQAPSQPEDNGNNGQGISNTHNPNNGNPGAARAQGRLPSGMQPQAAPAPNGAPEAPGGRFQDEKNREEIGKTPEGRR